MGRTSLQAPDQILVRNLPPPGLQGRDRRSATPRPDQDRHHDAEGQRDPCPLEQVRKLALKNVVSTITKGMTIAAAAATRKFHSFQITTKPMTPSTSMVVETAM